MSAENLVDYERGGTQKAVYSEDEVIAVACPLCGAHEGDRVFTEHGAIGIQRCRECSLIFTSPRIRQPEAVYWGDYESYLAEARLILAGRASHHRDSNYTEELELIERNRPDKGRILDVGCNMGMLLRLARDRGWDTVGVEPSPSLHRIATEQLGLEVHNCFLDELPDSLHGAFDVVALSDVFEHVTEPGDFLRTAGRYVKPGGLLYIKVPNARWSVLKQRLAQMTRRGSMPTIWDSYEHVVHYTERTLKAMLEHGGFDPLAITTARPVQTPAWHLYVGQYYLHPSPWVLDWKRHLGRAAFYGLARVDMRLRPGRIGPFAPSLVAVARCARG